MRALTKELKRFLPGLMASAMVLLTVGILLFISLDDDEEPDAIISYYPEEVHANIPVLFDGRNSTDPDGDDRDLEFSWNIMDEFRCSLPSMVFSFPQPGTYTVILMVTDVSGRSDTESIVIEVL